jgi:PAS domain S-box-containing protein
VIFRVRLAPRPRLEYINRAVLAITGYSPEDWYGDGGLAMRIVHASDRRKLQEIARARRLPAQPVVMRWIRRDGGALRTEISAIPVYGRRGALVAIEGIARDVTTIRGNGGTGRNDGRFLRVAFEQLPIGAAHIGADGRFLRVNRRLCAMTGFSPDEFRAKRLHDVADSGDGDRGAGLLQQLRTSDLAEATIEERWICKDGSHAWVRITASRLGTAGSAESIVLVARVPAPVAREEEQHRVTYGGIDVDTDRLEVSWNARQVALTLKEVLLLRYLIRHRGEMLARDRLLRDVWGYEHTGRSRTLDVHICRLRRKLPPLAESLVTIGHFGYTLSQAVGYAQATVGVGGAG